MLLYINAAVRSESRTARLARALIKKLGAEPTERCLAQMQLSPLDETALRERSEKIGLRQFADPAFALAREFAAADEIVIAAPYWDLTFPAVLKTYLENICVMGIASTYDTDGNPHGLCRAKKLWYVTTAGGPYLREFGYGQIEALAKSYFGIPHTELIYAENLDIVGNDAEKILQDAIAAL